MTPVYGIPFKDEVAPLVQELTDGVIAMCGSSCRFNAHGQIKFALRSPAMAKKAYHLFLHIRPTRNGAIARRPRIPKTGVKDIELNGKNDVERALSATRQWYQEVQEWKRPRAYQGTGDRRVMPGGQVESNRAKH